MHHYCLIKKLRIWLRMSERPRLNIEEQKLIEMHKRMLRIRYFDEKCSRMVKFGLIPGTVHTSIGQEAQVVGATMALEKKIS